MNTQSFKKSDIEESWIIVDASKKTLGRLASKLAFRLRGKHKPEYSANADLGDNIVVINAKDIHVTGKKKIQTLYYRHSGFPGGIKSKPLGEILASNPEEAIKLAVKGMLPKSKLGRQMIRKLKVYADDSHPHQAQNPQSIDI
jgi:large subunit ribosomal protein L13